MLRMDTEKRIKNLSEERYQAVFGVKKATFDAMLLILETSYAQMRKRGGRKRFLGVLDMLVVWFAYYHDYRTMENIAFDYLCHKQRVSEAVNWVEKALVKDGSFALPSKRSLVKDGTELVIAIVDATECETQRPKKNNAKATRGNKNATP